MLKIRGMELHTQSRKDKTRKRSEKEARLYVKDRGRFDDSGERQTERWTDGWQVKGGGIREWWEEKRTQD